MEHLEPVFLPDSELTRIFPRWWLSGEVDNDEVQARCDVLLRDGPPPTQAVIGVGWTPARTARFVRSCTREMPRPEGWQPNARSWVMSMHRTDRPSAEAPLGFLGFRPELGYDPACGAALAFRVNIDLVWVTPAVRERGYGTHIAAHLLRYLEANPIPASHFGNTIQGLEVTIVRSRQTSCRWLASKLASSLEVDRAFTSQAEAHPEQSLPAWPVVSVNVCDEDD